MHKLYVIEGVDGTGKTTTARELATHLGAEYKACPPEGLRPSRSFADKSMDYLARFFFYLAGNIQVAQDVKEILTAKPVVLDRYVLSTLCYHSALLGRDLREFVPRGDLLVPSHTLILEVDEFTRMERLKRKLELGSEAHIESDSDLMDRVRGEYALLSGFLGVSTIIDTSRLKPDDVIARVKTII